MAKDRLDAHVRDIVRWHFNPATGCPFWLERAKSLDFDPLQDVLTYDDLDKFGPFEDEWLRGGPVRRWVPKAYADKPIYVFETGGSTGVPKSRIAHEDFRIDYTNFSETLPGRRVSEGRGLADGGAERAASAATGHRAPGADPWRHLFHGRSRSAVGHQTGQGAADGADGGLQAPCHRSGADAPARAREHQVPVHHAEAARGALRESLPQEDGHSRRVLRRHRDDAAVPSLCG